MFSSYNCDDGKVQTEYTVENMLSPMTGKVTSLHRKYTHEGNPVLACSLTSKHSDARLPQNVKKSFYIQI